MYLPEGFSIVTPYMFVEGADKFSTFLSSAFDAKEKSRTLRPDGVIANMQMEIGTAMFMVSEASDAFPAMPSAYYLYVENADTSMTKALGAGAELVMEVGDMPYGDRQGGVRDPFGNIWWISQRLIQENY